MNQNSATSAAMASRKAETPSTEEELRPSPKKVCKGIPRRKSHVNQAMPSRKAESPSTEEESCPSPKEVCKGIPRRKSQVSLIQLILLFCICRAGADVKHKRSSLVAAKTLQNLWLA